MDDGLTSHSPAEPAISQGVRRFLQAQGVRDHNHASEIARIIDVDRSQSYRRLKGEVAWSTADLRLIARHFGAAEDLLLPRDESGRVHTGPLGVTATLRIPHLPTTGQLLPGPAMAADASSDLVAVQLPGGAWEVWLGGEEPLGLPRHTVESLTLRSLPHLQVALLEDDANAAGALVDAFRPLGIQATPFAGRAALMEALPRRRFDAFVLDWLLPDGNAADVVEAIRRVRQHVPVVVVTGALVADLDAERLLQRLSLEWNFSTLDKPVRPMNLANAIKQLVAVAKD